jgi:pimeloyl-ACP methyl ester carboxylesterase
MSEFAASAKSPPHSQEVAGTKFYVDGPHGQIFARRYGNASSPAMLLLHDVPGTSLSLQTLAQNLAETYHVIVPDHPGSGLSDAPANGDHLRIAADNIIAVSDTLGIENFTVAAIGTGAAVAAQLAKNTRAKNFIIAETPDTDPAQVAPEISLSPTGAHWVQAWLMLRDNQIYSPWYDGSVAAQRHTQGNFDAGWMQDQTAAFMEGRATYFHLPRAAATYPARQILSATGKPLTLLPEEDFLRGAFKQFEWEALNDVDA